jgi:hypothetical protein
MIEISTSGSTDRTDRWLKRMARGEMYRPISAGAKMGVSALSAATPVDTGLTAASWGSTVIQSLSGAKITWTNSHINRGFNVAVGLQYGHGTGTGGYVQGRDYINPAMRAVFQKIADDVWRVVTSG